MAYEQKQGEQKVKGKFFLKKMTAEGAFSGYASVYDQVDQHKDKVQRGAFRKSLGKMKEACTFPKMLWQHDPAFPIGKWECVEEQEKGLYVEGRLFLELPKAREAYVLLKEKVVEGLSIGYETVKASRCAAYRLLEEVRLFEISLVTFPANTAARVLGVKKEGQELLEKIEGLQRILRGEA